MNEKQNSILMKLNYSKCLKCQKAFKTNDEIILLKDSRILHKPCYEQLRKMIQEEKNV